MTDCTGLLMFASTTYPSMPARIRSTSGKGAEMAAMQPLSPSETRFISRPRALTICSASPKVSTPAVTKAAYSPKLWPITMSGTRP